MTHTKTLVQHVLASNAIEQIFASPGEALYDQHLRAACGVEVLACGGVLSHPLKIHEILLPDLAGYRPCPVYVGDREMPPHEVVPKLMGDWECAYQQLFNQLPDRSDPSRDPLAASTAMLLQSWLLCIHPFVDGNGRTARLVLNSFRRPAGLNWHIVGSLERHEYYSRIRAFENTLFSRWYPPELW